MRICPMMLIGCLVGAKSFAADPAGTSANPLADARSHFARLDTNRVHYQALGKGPEAVVFVHGWCGSVDFWRFQVPSLQGKARLILLDLPGHGKSDQPQTAYTMDFFARAVDAVMRDAKVEKATLVGHSMGTSVICRFYCQFPSKVRALVAVDGSLRGFDMAREKFEEFVAPYRTPQYRETAAKFIGAMFPNPGTEALRDRALEVVTRTPQHVMVSAFEGLFDKAVWEPEKVEVPLLVINARSPFWSEDYEPFVRRLQPKVDYHVMEGVGHFLMLEKPEEFNATLLAFLEKNGLVPKSGTESEKEADWKLLFDGQTTKGWRGYKKPTFPEKGWAVEDGCLKKIAGVTGGDIITEEAFNDFELSWEWRIAPGGNNGLKYLVTEDRPSAPGHEYQMIDDASNADGKVGPRHATASFYDVLPPSADLPLKRAGEWNRSGIIVQGNHVEHWLNGRKVLEYELGSEAVKAAVANSKFKSAPGFGAKIKGHILLTDHHDECWFRDIRIRELPGK